MIGMGLYGKERKLTIVLLGQRSSYHDKTVRCILVGLIFEFGCLPAPSELVIAESSQDTLDGLADSGYDSITYLVLVEKRKNLAVVPLGVAPNPYPVYRGGQFGQGIFYELSLL